MSDAGLSIADLGAMAATPIDAQLNKLADVVRDAPALRPEIAALSGEIREIVHSLVDDTDSVTAALIRSYDRIEAFRALSLAGLSTLEGSDVYGALLEQARNLTSSDVAVLYHADTILGAVGSASAVDSLETELRDADAAPATPVQSQPADTPTVIVAISADADAPLIGLQRRKHGKPFSTGDLQLVESVAAVAEMTHQLVVLHESELRQAAVEREHQLASTLAQAALDMPDPQLPGVDYFGTTLPASLAGGDFHTCSVVDDAIWFAVGDVAGKGLPAALVMTRAVSAARVAFRTHRLDDVDGAMRSLSDEIFNYLDDVGLFITVVLGCFRPSSGLLTYANAGHSPVVLVRGQSTELLRPTGPPVGVLERPTASTVSVVLNPGERLILGSDGLVEQGDAAGAMVGYDGFLDLCVPHSDEDAREHAARILASVQKHGEGTLPTDDRTIVVVRAALPANAAGDSGIGDLVIPATNLALRDIGPWLRPALASVPEQAVDTVFSRLELAVHELGTNIVHHSGQTESDAIRISVAVEATHVVVTVRAGGVAFDPASAPEPLPGAVQEHGYGILMVRKLTDSLTYRRIGDENVHTLVVSFGRVIEEDAR